MVEEKSFFFFWVGEKSWSRLALYYTKKRVFAITWSKERYCEPEEIIIDIINNMALDESFIGPIIFR